MITQELLSEAIFDTIKKSACRIPPDVRDAFEGAIRTERKPISKTALENTLRSLECSIENENPACADTGWPLFFCKIGNEAVIPGGIVGLETVAKQMVAKASYEGFLRKTMRHPLTGYDPGNNIGLNVPGFTYKFVPGSDVQITFACKGGGSELFGGSRYRVIAYSDGIAGIEKFIVDAYAAGSRSGAICPPSILGVGIGGTADICTKLAKEAAVLRPVGSRHPEPDIAKIEKDLFDALSELRIGTMGSGGDVSVFAVHVEYAYTHIGGIAVAVNTNCFITRRATTRIFADGRLEARDDPDWFERRTA
jgi:L(+)-tartrate dehydratase alpha subunit